MSHVLKVAMDGFNRMYSEITKVVSFNQHWNAGPLSVAGAVRDPNFRLILEHGDRMKSVDPKGRRIIFMGTKYGLIAINETYSGNGDPCKPLHYAITQALSYVWEAYERTHVPVSDYVHANNVPKFFDITFLQRIGEIATQEIAFGRMPSDGMRTYIGSVKHKVDTPKQVHNRRHVDDKKNQQFQRNAQQQKQPEATARPLRVKEKKATRPLKHMPIAEALMECAQEASATA